jgi:hypothetical protein
MNLSLLWCLQIKMGDRYETVRFFHCYKRGVDRVFVDHPLFLERVRWDLITRYAITTPL